MEKASKTHKQRVEVSVLIKRRSSNIIRNCLTWCDHAGVQCTSRLAVRTLRHPESELDQVAGSRLVTETRSMDGAWTFGLA